MHALKITNFSLARFTIACAAWIVMAVLVLATIPLQGQRPAEYDVVILGGRVMDPESGLDAVRNIGIRDDMIAAITTKQIVGKTTIDAVNLVVAPGFIDMHEHGQAQEKYRYQVRDGVTTSLELEYGAADIDAWYAARDGKSLINFGVSVGHIPIRMHVMHDPGAWLPTGDAAHREATEAELQQIGAQIQKGLDRGALAIGMGIDYTPAATHREIFDMFQIAGHNHVPVHVHLRYGGMKEPEVGLSGLEEVLAAAAATGASLHVVHVTSMGLRDTPVLLQMIKGARAHGMDVTTESYPYTAGSTRIESAIFDGDWQQRFGISYPQLQWVATGERLNRESFEKYRKQTGAVVIHMIPEEVVRMAIVDPTVAIASDGTPAVGPKVHPRGQGTYARVLGYYVREQHALSLMDAIRKTSYLAAHRLEAHAPQFRNKGRIRVGADADITIFDPQTVHDRATYENPLQFSQGIPNVLVNGVLVVKNSDFVQGATPGRAARAPIK